MQWKKPWFVDSLAESDSEMAQALERVIELAMGPGVLELKTKLLIVLALDAFKGAERGVAAVAEQARQAGATEEEIREVLRIAYLIAGMDCLRAGSRAYIRDVQG